MMSAAVINMILGGGLKMVSTGFGKWMEHKRQKDLAVLNAPTEKLLALQSGEDKADYFTRWTRRLLAFMIIGVFLYILIHLTIIAPETKFEILITQDRSWFWDLVSPFPRSDKGVITVSGGAMLYDAWNGVWLIIGFYFTKVGR